MLRESSSDKRVTTSNMLKFTPISSQTHEPYLSKKYLAKSVSHLVLTS